MRLVRADPLRHQSAAGKLPYNFTVVGEFRRTLSKWRYLEFHSPKTMELILVVVISAGMVENSQNVVSRKNGHIEAHIGNAEIFFLHMIAGYLNYVLLKAYCYWTSPILTIATFFFQKGLLVGQEAPGWRLAPITHFSKTIVNFICKIHWIISDKDYKLY